MASKKATTKTPKTKRPKTKFWTTYNPETGTLDCTFEKAKDAKESAEQNGFAVAGPYVLSERKALR